MVCIIFQKKYTESSGLKNEPGKHLTLLTIEEWEEKVTSLGKYKRRYLLGRKKRRYLLGRKKAKTVVSLEPVDKKFYKRMVNITTECTKEMKKFKEAIGSDK